MGFHTLEQVRQRQLHEGGLLVRVAIKDPYQQLCRGTVLIVSSTEVALFTESPPRSEALEIQPLNSDLWISVQARHCLSVSSGYILECAFPSPATPDVLEALYQPR